MLTLRFGRPSMSGDAIARGEWSLRAGPDGDLVSPARPRRRIDGSIIAWFWNGQ